MILIHVARPKFYLFQHWIYHEFSYRVYADGGLNGFSNLAFPHQPIKWNWFTIAKLFFFFFAKTTNWKYLKRKIDNLEQIQYRGNCLAPSKPFIMWIWIEFVLCLTVFYSIIYITITWRYISIYFLIFKSYLNLCTLE